jgi:hypothetical protein
LISLHTLPFEVVISTESLIFSTEYRSGPEWAKHVSVG